MPLGLAVFGALVFIRTLLPRRLSHLQFRLQPPGNVQSFWGCWSSASSQEEMPPRGCCHYVYLDWLGLDRRLGKI